MGLARQVSREEKDKEYAGQLKGLESSPMFVPPLPSAPRISAGGQGVPLSPSTPDTMPEATAVNGQVSGHKILLLCGLLMWSPPGKHLCRQNTGVKECRNLKPVQAHSPGVLRQLLLRGLYYQSLPESVPGSQTLLLKQGS